MALLACSHPPFVSQAELPGSPAMAHQHFGIETHGCWHMHSRSDEAHLTMLLLTASLAVKQGAHTLEST